MKTMKFFLIVLSMLLGLYINAQTTTPKKIIIIDGHFFNEIPVAKQNITKMHILKTPSGITAMGIELSQPLPDAALQYAIAIEQVSEGELLLQRYNEAKANSKGVSISFNNTPTLKEGDKFPDFSAIDIDGKKWTNTDVKGKVMVLNLWFTGCAPCRAEMPELSKWKDEMPDVMFFSSTYENAKRARPVLESQKFNWIPLVNDTQFKEFIGNNGYPMTIVIDKNGIISKVEYGTSLMQRNELKKKIQSLR